MPWSVCRGDLGPQTGTRTSPNDKPVTKRPRPSHMVSVKPHAGRRPTARLMTTTGADCAHATVADVTTTGARKYRPPDAGWLR
ncbi:hypothetical protein [Nocardia sp. NPDC058633]|uniref:hypothetical protein n=1 Tax=Nocardia sp. NPDC058633 TaxID=3346568 RepID=UPI00365E73C8